MTIFYKHGLELQRNRIKKKKQAKMKRVKKTKQRIGEVTWETVKTVT